MAPSTIASGEPLRVELEAQLVALTDELVQRPAEAVAVDLEAVAQPRLDDPLPRLDLADQAMDVGNEVLVDLVDVGGDDGAEEQAAEAGRRVGGQDEVAEGDTRSRRQPRGGCARPPARRGASTSDVRADERAQVLRRADHVRRVRLGGVGSPRRVGRTPRPRRATTFLASPYGGCAGSHAAASTATSSRPIRSSGSLASRSAAANSRGRASSGGAAAAPATIVPASMPSSSSSTAGSASAATKIVAPSQRWAIAGVDERRGQRRPVVVGPLVEPVLDRRLVLVRARSGTARARPRAGRTGRRCGPRAPRGRPARRRPTRGRCPRRRAPPTARRAVRGSTPTTS